MVYSNRIKLACTHRDATPPPRSSQKQNWIIKTSCCSMLCPASTLPFPGVELGQKHSNPFSSLVLSTAASHFVSEEKKSKFLCQYHWFLPLLWQLTRPCEKYELSLVWEDASRLGKGAPSSFRISASAPVPPATGPGGVSGAAGSSQEGSRQPASFGVCSQALSCPKTLPMVLTSTSQEVSPPTQSQLLLFLCKIQLRLCATTYLPDLMSFFPVCVGDVPVRGPVTGGRGGDPRLAAGLSRTATELCCRVPQLPLTS